MARGPLPGKSGGATRRTNPPTIPTTTLPAAGRKGRVPKLPHGYDLRAAGVAWWKWAWRLPQAAAWDTGALYHLARRAQLEDDLALLGRFDHFDLAELLGMDEENDVVRHLEWVIGGLKRMAGGEATLMREMRELDNRLGLNPKALADLRWTIADDTAPVQAPVATAGSTRRLRAVDPVAVAR